MSYNRRPVEPHFPQHPALLVVDMQRYFVDEDGDAFLEMSRDIINPVNGLISTFKEKGYPVIFTRHAHVSKETAGIMDGWWGDLIMDGTISSQITETIGMDDSDVVLVKERYSAFIGTGLANLFQKNGCDGLVICGVMTHLCVETTARDAFMNDLRVVVCHDACASDTIEHHEGALSNLAHGFALVLSSTEIREVLE